MIIGAEVDEFFRKYNNKYLCSVPFQMISCLQRMRAAEMFLRFVPLLLFPLLLLPFPSSSSASSDADGGGDVGVSLGSSAATKLVRNAVESALRASRYIKFEIESKPDARYSVAHVTSLNRVAVGGFCLCFMHSGFCLFLII